MHNQDLINDIKTGIFSQPQKCIKILSNKSFLNNLFQQHLEQLVSILQSSLQKMNKQNKNISFVSTNQEIKPNELNSQLIVCFYSIIIMKSTKSVASSEENPIFNSKLAIQTLTKIHRQSKQEDIKKIVAALLLKIHNFSNHKNIVRDLDPQFISIKTMNKASQQFKLQCPNLYEQKLNSYKQTEWSKYLSYKPFKLDIFSDSLKKIQTLGMNLTDANILIQIKDQIKAQFQFLMNRIKLIRKEEFFIFQFCQKFTELFRIKLDFPKILSNHKFLADSKNQLSTKSLPNYNLNQLRLKIVLEARNYLLIILTSLITKLSSYWTRKIKWLYDFIIERVQTYGLEQMGILSIEEPQIYVEKLKQLKLTIKLCRVYYKQFGNGLFPDDKLKGVLFTQEFSFYKMIEAILYNEYQFVWHSQSGRIVNYQKSKKINQEVKSKQNLIKMVNVNSKSLNINPHYDLVFQKVIQQLTYKEGSSYAFLRQLIAEALRFMSNYYKKSQTYFYGGNLISMIQNCKNSQIPKQTIRQLLQDIKRTLYPNKRMIKQGLQFFCEEVYQSYASKKRLLEVQTKKISPTLNICKTTYLTIHSNQSNQQQGPGYSSILKIQPSPNDLTSKGGIRKTKSYDMVIQGWNQQQKNQSNSIPIRSQDKKQDYEIFYSIKQCSPKDQNDPEKEDKGLSSLENVQSKYQSIKENEPQGDDNAILIPEF